MHVSLSHEIGSVGLLERENATVLNGALVGVVEGLAAALDDALEAEGVHAETFVTQNDGTLMLLQHARRFPVLTIGSGPASGMRGAAFLSGVEDGLVVDVGGSHTDVGVLVSGFPRETADRARIAGVRVALWMPDVRTLSFGGGSPLAEEAALARAHEALADRVDRAKAELQSPPLVAVGGADVLVPDDLPGVSEVIRPPDREVASAIGAAMAPVSAHAECICSSRPDRRLAALDDVRASACAQAVHAGADPTAVSVVQVQEVPLNYLAEPAIRIRAKAAGPAG
jgi:N-methylhydantoinase A/oxoprolinase/acetone carboxylase beta subunit